MRATVFTLIACVLASSAAVPAIAADRVTMELECSATRPGWTEPRVFTVAYVGGNGRLKDVVVTEKARVFTPTDDKSIYIKRGKGKKAQGVIITLADKRDGKWSGKVEDEGDEFKMRAKDGSASFVLAPAPANDKLRLLTWQADMEIAKDEELSWEGAGTCRVVSPEADALPARKEPGKEVSKAAREEAPKAPRKEIRLFGGRKSAPADGDGK
jgi:hypothetical protein